MKTLKSVMFCSMILLIANLKAQTAEISKVKTNSVNANHVIFKSEFLNYDLTAKQAIWQSNSILLNNAPLKPAAALVVASASYILNNTSRNRSQTSMKAYLENVSKVDIPPLNRQNSVVLKE